MERLHKRLAHAGVASRRKAEAMIREGRVEVDGVVVTQMGMLISPTSEIRVDHQPIQIESKVYFLLNKPPKVLSTVSDNRHRKTVVELIDVPHRIYPVGRLDYTTTGALILTNDGEFANALMHPSFHVDKTYEVHIHGLLTQQHIHMLEQGVRLEDGSITASGRVSNLVLIASKKQSQFSLTIHEGRYHQVKRMMEALNHKVIRLHRSHYAFLDLKGLSFGQYRKLKPFEIKKLKNLSQRGEPR